MPQYAAKTEVPADRSRAEIERTLERYGADQFIYGWDGPRARIGFRMAGRQVRLDVPLPERTDPKYQQTATGRYRASSEAARAAWEQDMRQRWRAVLLIIKAKLEAIDAGISTFDAEFLSAIMLPNGHTVGEHLEPQLDHIYATGQMPRLLPGPTGPLLPEGHED
jgi:hypothetical protein